MSPDITRTARPPGTERWTAPPEGHSPQGSRAGSPREASMPREAALARPKGQSFLPTGPSMGGCPPWRTAGLREFVWGQ